MNREDIALGWQRRVIRVRSLRDPGARLRLLQVFLGGFALLTLVVRTAPAYVYAKDIQQDYVTAWALRDGLPLLTPLPELTVRYLPATPDRYPHPSPHPPILAVLMLPFTVLPFPLVVPLWLLLNLGLVAIVGRYLGCSWLGTFALAAWPPLWMALDWGQWEVVLLALALLGWRAAGAGRDWRAGAWLGLAAALKLYPLVLLVAFLVRRRTRVVLAAALVFGLGQLGNLLLVGASGLVRYYVEILPGVARLYIGTAPNSSPYGALLRLFGGSTDVRPLFWAPEVVVPLSAIFVAVAVLGLLKLPAEAAPVSLLVGLPSVAATYAALALPWMVGLLRLHMFRLLALPAIAMASAGFTLVNLALGVTLSVVQLDSSLVATIAIASLAVQPGGYLALLVLSIALRMADLDSVVSGRTLVEAQSLTGVGQADRGVY